MLIAVAWVASGVAHAQLVTVTVQGATEEARAFTTLYRAQAQTSSWTILGSMVRIYRVDDHAGTVKINAVLGENTPPRTAQDPTSQQSLRLHTAWDDTTLVSAPPQFPDKPVEVSYEFPFTADGIGERVVVFSTKPYAAWCGFDSVDCDTIEGFLVFLLRDTPQITLGGSVRPPLYQGNPKYLRFQFPVLGMSPLTEITSVLIDGIAMTRIPSSLSQSPGNGEWYLLYPGPDPVDPITAGEVIYPGFVPTSVDRFLGCGGGGCGPPNVTLGLPADLGTGLHRLAVKGSRWQDAYYTFFGNTASTNPPPGEPAGYADLDAEEDFIVVDPKLSVSPSQAEPGSTITVTGTGFAPESQVPVRFGIDCCSVREPLGTATTDMTGAFTLQATLPTDPFANVWPSSAAPGTTTSGTLLAPVGDAGFLLKYGLPAAEYSGAITFVKPGATPATTTTTTPGTTPTTTTLAGLDDVPACAATPVPARAVQKFDAAEANVDLIEQMIAEHAARKAIRKVLGKTDASLLKVRQLIKRALKHDLIPESCAAPAIDLINQLRDRAQEARQSLKR